MIYLFFCWVVCIFVVYEKGSYEENRGSYCGG